MDTKVIGNKIAKARKEINMSQAQLAQLLFISPQAVGKWERGESIPDILTFNRLAEILGVDLNYFSENFRPAENETTAPVAADNTAGNQQPAQGASRNLLSNFSGNNLPDTDFAGVTAHKSKFNGSALRGSDFSGADLTGTTFSGSDVQGANFDGANLTDCTFTASSLMGTSFNKTILVRAEFNASGLDGAKFSNAELVDVKLVNTDLRKTAFENCTFRGVDFKHSDLRGANMEGQTFIDVKFDKAGLSETQFNRAVFKNVSFRPPLALTNKYYKAIKTISFNGATMDKLTYAALKGMGADLSSVTVS